MNNTKSLSAMAAQIASLATTVETLLRKAQPDFATEAEPVIRPTHMAVKSAFGREDDDTDPNVVMVHITEGYMRNRMTLPREIYTKSRRDSYVHADRTVTDPKTSFVVVDGTKYPQTNNQGRSSKMYPSTFGVKAEGQTLVFTKVKGNTWESHVKGKVAKGTVAEHQPASRRTTAKPAAKGTKVAANKSNGKVANPFAPKAQAKPTGKAQTAGSWPQTLSNSVKHVKANAKAEFYNDKVIPQHNHDYRVYLQTSQHKAFKTAAKEAGLTLLDAVNKLQKACEA